MKNVDAILLQEFQPRVDLLAVFQANQVCWICLSCCFQLMMSILCHLRSDCVTHRRDDYEECRCYSAAGISTKGRFAGRFPSKPGVLDLLIMLLSIDDVNFVSFAI